MCQVEGNSSKKLQCMTLSARELVCSQRPGNPRQLAEMVIGVLRAIFTLKGVPPFPRGMDAWVFWGLVAWLGMALIGPP